MKKYYLINNNVFDRVQLLKYLDDIMYDKFNLHLSLIVIDNAYFAGIKSTYIVLGGFNTLVQFINVRIK